MDATLVWQAIKSEKNVALFEKMQVMSPKETEARADVMHEHYAGVVEMEAICMMDMIKQHVLPAVYRIRKVPAWRVGMIRTGSPYGALPEGDAFLNAGF